MHMKNRIIIAGSLLICLICFLFWLDSSHLPTKYTASLAQKENIVILLDAGHGGKDGGAVAADGTEEQYINLQIAKNIEAQLQALGVPVQMTRTDDASIHDDSAITIREQKVSDIHNRMKLLDETPNAVLVSIHQNKFADTNLWGTQVFYSPNTTNSPALAASIQNTVCALLQPDNTRKIKKSGSSIYLLYHAKKPAVLVECGFLSNPDECALLKDSSYQQKMAFAITMGILEYINV